MRAPIIKSIAALARVTGLIALSSCIEFGLDPIDSGEAPNQLVAVMDEFVQAPLPAVDILFVVDDTASMGQEQEALGDDFSAFSTDLAQSGIGWQIGVVTTDMASDSAGILRGNPWILTPDTDDLDLRFSEMIEVGTSGSADEAGLAAAVLALELTEPGGVNAGFRREGAGLHVIFVSDSDDNSDAYLDDPVVSFLAALAGEGTEEVPAVASTLSGDVPAGCVSVMGTAGAGHRYAQVAQSSGGVEVSICAPDFTPLLETLGHATVTYLRSFRLSEIPLLDSVRVTVDGTVETEGFVVDYELGVVTFDLPPAAQAQVAVSYLVGNE